MVSELIQLFTNNKIERRQCKIKARAEKEEADEQNETNKLKKTRNKMDYVFCGNDGASRNEDILTLTSESYAFNGVFLQLLLLSGS